MPRPATRRRVGKPTTAVGRTSGVNRRTSGSSTTKSNPQVNKDTSKARDNVNENEAGSPRTVATKPSLSEPDLANSNDQNSVKTKPRNSQGNNVMKDLPSYPTLETRQRKINTGVIDDSWQLMTDTSQAEVIDILNRSVKNIIQTGKSERARIEMQTMLNQLVAKCEKSLKKVQIPPKSKDKYLDYEHLLNENAKLSEQLNSEKRQIAQLKAEIAREDRQAEKNDKLLDSLKANAESEDKVRRKKAQSLLPAFKHNPKDEHDVDMLNDKIPLHEEPLAIDAAAYDVSLDEELMSLMRKLERHLESLQENREILRDIPQYMQAARAAVDDYLFHTEYYDAVSAV